MNITHVSMDGDSLYYGDPIPGQRERCIDACEGLEHGQFAKTVVVEICDNLIPHSNAGMDIRLTPDAALALAVRLIHASMVARGRK